jgi:hypothetical protein
MEQMIILQTMLDKAKKYNLEMECLVSLINEITDKSLSLQQLSNACEHALCEWDI